jgi:DNA-binding transcriptional regulator YiaG
MNDDERKNVEAIAKAAFNKLTQTGISDLTTGRLDDESNIIPVLNILDDEESIQALANIPDSWSKNDPLLYDCLVFTFQTWIISKNKAEQGKEFAYTSKCVNNRVNDIIRYHSKTLSSDNHYAYMQNIRSDSEDLYSDNEECYTEKNVFSKEDRKKTKIQKFDLNYWEVVKLYRISGMTQEKLAIYFGIHRKTLIGYMKFNFIFKRHLTPEKYLEKYAEQYGKNDFYQDCLKNISLFSKENASIDLKCDFEGVFINRDKIF